VKLARTGLLLAGVLLSCACGKGSTPQEAAPVAGSASAEPAPSVVATPVDQLAPGELVEGPEEAFGVKLPRDLKVERRYPDTVYASGPMNVHALVEYFRPRLRDGALREGKDAATFEHVHVPGQPGLEARVHIVVGLGATRVEIANVTPPPMPDLPDEAARWRQVGLRPDGKVLDPTHLD